MKAGLFEIFCACTLVRTHPPRIAHTLAAGALTWVVGDPGLSPYSDLEQGLVLGSPSSQMRAPTAGLLAILKISLSRFIRNSILDLRKLPDENFIKTDTFLRKDFVVMN